MPGWFKRKARITEDIYGRLITSFGRVVDLDPLIRQPAEALADRVIAESPELTSAVDAGMYNGAAKYHLKLLAASWIMSHDGSVPVGTAEVFEEALVWKFGALVPHSAHLPHRLSALARGEAPRDTHLD